MGNWPGYRAETRVYPLARYLGYKIKRIRKTRFYSLTIPDEPDQELTAEEAEEFMDRRLIKELRKKNGVE